MCRTVEVAAILAVRHDGVPDRMLGGKERTMRRAVLVAGLVPWLLAMVANAQQVKVREEMLENGMRLLMVERHDVPTVACGFTARVGSVNEPQGITGITHLFEHMMFKGSKTIGTSDWPKEEAVLAQQDAVRGEMEKEYTALRAKLRLGEISGSIYDPANQTPRLKELKAELEKLYEEEKKYIVKEELETTYARAGGSGLNAFTSEDQTVYFVTLPANKLELWFWIDSDRLQSPVFREFYSERDVVREERRLAVESTPTGLIEEAFEAMFWEASPYSHPVIGWPSDVESITRAQAEDYFAKHYAPNNVTAVLVGDFNPEHALELARKYFGRIPRGVVPPPEMITAELSQPAEKRMAAEAETNPEVTIRFHAVPFNHSDSFPLTLAADILNKRTGRLYKSLVEGKQVAVGEPYAFARPMKYEGTFEVGAEVKDGSSPEAVEAALMAELTALAEQPVDERELTKVKNQVLADSYRKLQSNMSLLIQLLVYDSEGDWKFLNDEAGKLQAVTAADVQRVAKTYFTPDRRSVLTLTRKAGAAAEDPELAALPAEMKAMIKQQVQSIGQSTDRAKLEGNLARMQGALEGVPPQMKPAMSILIKKIQQRLAELPAEKK